MTYKEDLEILEAKSFLYEQRNLGYLIDDILQDEKTYRLRTSEFIKVMNLYNDGLGLSEIVTHIKQARA